MGHEKATLALAIVIVCVLVILWWKRTRKHEAITAAPGANTGMYLDGTTIRPCAQCTDMRKCPSCPQYLLYTTPQLPIESFEVPTPTPRIDTPSDPIARALRAYDPAALEYDPVNNDALFDEHGAAAGTMPCGRPQARCYAPNPDILTPREGPIGVCSGMSRSRRASGPIALDTSLLGVRNDDIFDGERAVSNHLRTCSNPTTSAQQLLYHSVMGLGRESMSKPHIDCEVMSYNGYSYKQRCDSSW